MSYGNWSHLTVEQLKKDTEEIHGYPRLICMWPYQCQAVHGGLRCMRRIGHWEWHYNTMPKDLSLIWPLERRDFWEANRELRKIEGVRRCLYCAGREDLHNDPRYMAGHEPGHPFDAPTAEELVEWEHAD